MRPLLPILVFMLAASVTRVSLAQQQSVPEVTPSAPSTAPTEIVIIDADGKEVLSPIHSSAPMPPVPVSPGIPKGLDPEANLVTDPAKIVGVPQKVAEPKSGVAPPLSRGTPTPEQSTELARLTKMVQDGNAVEARVQLAELAKTTAAAAFVLAGLYEEGIGGGVDLDQAIRWYVKAHNAGDLNATEALGHKYRNGFEGLADKKPKEALVWFKKAADAGRSGAAIALGEMHLAGEGVPKNPATAYAFYLKAAEEFSAKLKLAKMHHEGIGTKQNPVEAYKWLTLAFAQPNQPKECPEKDRAIETKRLLEESLSAQQLEEVRKMAAAWAPASAKKPQGQKPMATAGKPAAK